jgi:hypothetical protein
MRVLSATDAISPAWTHTRSLLLGPRSWRLVLKIGLVAVFAHFGGCNGNYSSPGPTSPAHIPAITQAVAAAVIATVLFAVLLLLLIGLAFFYLGSRLQLVFFDLVLRRETIIAPIWRRYGRITWSWIAIKIVFGLIALAVFIPLLLPIGLYLFNHASNLDQYFNQHVGQTIFLVVVLFLAIFGLGLIFALAYRLLYDFGLPSMALEGTSLGETSKRVLRLFRAETGQVLLYILMRIVLGMAFGLANAVIVLLFVFIAAIPLGGIGVALWAIFHHGDLAGKVVLGVGFTLLALIFLALLLALIFALTAWTSTFFQAYALYFLGGRYPLLGDLLDHHTPPPPTFPPPGYYPPYAVPPLQP